ncbi:MAG TPA: TIGR03618 family F420-dependent PPOX class oxidoreductase [Acidimicrobiales bacterium]|nr:TIGR03618 family F420-dependent PPOX class oxidoreductase [Acidimicrobiales bacterium]
MPSRRELVRMSDAEIDAFLHERHSMSVATFNHDDTIHLVAMWYGFYQGKPAFETFTKSQKILNLRRDGRISVLVEDGDAYEKLRGVEIVGRGEVIDDKSILGEVAASVVERYMGVSGEAAEQAAQMLMQKRSAVVIHPERIVSWDHNKLGGTY